ncbi:hypothetical protein AYI69_g6655 [Smittium culicis]|uniref:RNA polymerase II assembly factor Rtp1 C-terminal domain-containing protein n=1 Tax=Smittium culicis TaxID=133412 RepID=A0A1R1XXR8_9FUNG|nr:hypothetical protein AYI69_g6655 [Smittium culicis]
MSEKVLYNILKCLNVNVNEIKSYFQVASQFQKTYIEQKTRYYNETPNIFTISASKYKENVDSFPSEDICKSPEIKTDIVLDQGIKANESSTSFSEEPQLAINENLNKNESVFDQEDCEKTIPNIEPVIVQDIEEFCEILYFNLLAAQTKLLEIIHDKSMAFEVELLGLQDKKTIGIILDFICIFALAPNLESNTTISFESRLKSSSIKNSGFNLEIFQKFTDIKNRIQKSLGFDSKTEIESQRLSQLIKWTKNLGCFASTPNYSIVEIGFISRTRSLADLISAYLQTAYSPTLAKRPDLISKDELITMKKQFSYIFNNPLNRSLILESLFAIMNFSTGKLKWFNVLVSRFLSRLLIMDNGINLLLSFILNTDSSDSDITSTKLKNISKLVLTSPKSLSEHDYFLIIIPQLFNLIKKSAHNNNANPQNSDDNKDLKNDSAGEKKIEIKHISIYILSDLSHRFPSIFKDIALPLLIQPFKLWSQKKISKVYRIPNSKKNDDRCSLIKDDSLGNLLLKDPSIASPLSKPLIQVLDDSLPSLSELNTLPSPLSVDNKTLESFSNYFSILQLNLPNTSNTSIDNQIISNNDDIKLCLEILTIICDRDMENSSFMISSLSPYVIRPLLVLYQYYSNILKYAESNDLTKIPGVSNLEIINIRSLTKKIISELDKMKFVLSRFFEEIPITESTAVVKALALNDRLESIINSKSTSGYSIYPLFAIDNKLEANLIYTFYYPDFIFSQDDRISDNSLKLNSLEDSEIGISQNEHLEIDDQVENSTNYIQLFQSKIEVLTLKNLSEKFKLSKELSDKNNSECKINAIFNQIVASLFISLLNEYGSVHEQIGDSDERESSLSNDNLIQNKKIQILSSKDEDDPKCRDDGQIKALNSPKRDYHNESGIDNNFVSELKNHSKYANLGQVLLDMLEMFGPSLLSNKEHLLAFINSILLKVYNSPPPQVNDNSINFFEKNNNSSFKLNSNDFSSLGNINSISNTVDIGIESENFINNLSAKINSGTNEIQKNNETIDTSISNSEQLIVALNLLYTLEFSDYNASSPDILEADNTQLYTDHIKSNIQSVTSLYSGIYELLTLLIPQWKNFPMVYELLKQAQDISKSHKKQDKNESYNSKTDDIDDFLSDPNSNTIEKGLSDILIDLQSELVPIVAYGLSNLKMHVESSSDPDNSILSFAVNIYIKFLEHEDSFIYLKSIRFLVELATLPDIPNISTLDTSSNLETQKKNFNNMSKKISKNKFKLVSSLLLQIYSDPGADLDLRLRVGEVLLGIGDRIGSALSIYGNYIIPTLLVTIDPRYSKNEARQTLEASSDIDRAKESDLLIHSSLSILGSYCKTCPLSLMSYQSDLIEFCKQIGISKSSSSGIKRASVSLLISIVNGYFFESDYKVPKLDKNKISVLKSVYSGLQLIRSSVLASTNSQSNDHQAIPSIEPDKSKLYEIDSLLIHNIDLGIEEIDSISRQFF